MKVTWDEIVIIKPNLDENVIGRNRFWMKVSWMKLSSFLDESVFR